MIIYFQLEILILIFYDRCVWYQHILSVFLNVEVHFAFIFWRILLDIGFLIDIGFFFFLSILNVLLFVISDEESTFNLTEDLLFLS